MSNKVKVSLVIILVFLAVFLLYLYLNPTIEKGIFIKNTEDKNFIFTVFPDTQFYSQKFPEIHRAQTDWVKENYQENHKLLRKLRTKYKKRERKKL